MTAARAHHQTEQQQHKLIECVEHEKAFTVVRDGHKKVRPAGEIRPPYIIVYYHHLYRLSV